MVAFFKRGPIATFMNVAIDLTWLHLLNVAIGPPLKYIYIYIYIYLVGPIATFTNVAIDMRDFFTLLGQASFILFF